MKKLISYIVLIISINLYGQKCDTMDLTNYYGKFDGGFAIRNLKTGNKTIYNPADCSTRFSPCSTFKIPNSLIGLESGVIKDQNFVIKYDSILHPKNPKLIASEPFKYWFQDLTLKQALKYSCVWYYQELARRVGAEKMKKYVDLLNYGNRDISSGVDNFWLCGSMQISIDEQIEFLKRMYLHKLPGISDRTINIVKDIMLYESTGTYKLYGKTGGGECWDNKVIGWYVGFVETKTGTYFFAMNIFVNNFSDLKDNFRIELTKNVLKKMNIIE